MSLAGAQTCVRWLKMVPRGDWLLFFLLLHLFLFSIIVNTPLKSPSMVTPTLWHLCLELMSPHIRKHCPHVLSFLISILGCPDPSVVFFLFCCNWLLMYLKKKKKKKKKKKN
jgi:4-amino-4-deoxy-L-arabinose transferase-like glycosyltransferase